MASKLTIDQIETIITTRFLKKTDDDHHHHHLDSDIGHEEDSDDLHLENIRTLHELRASIISNPELQCAQLYKIMIDLFNHHVYQELEHKMAPSYEIDMEEEDFIITNEGAEKIATIEFIIAIIEDQNFQMPVAKKSVTIDFVNKVINLFYIDDPKEREMLKSLLYKLYTKFLNFRKKIRDKIKMMFQEIVAMKYYCPGINQLLDLLASIISGFAKPVKAEHKQFLKESLIPLLKMPNLAQFDYKLSIALFYFCEKDTECLQIVFESILRFWPRTAPTKELKFVYYISELLKYCSDELIHQYQDRLMNQICRCLASDHCQLIEQIIKLLYENDKINQIIESNPEFYLTKILSCYPHIDPDDWNGTLVCYFKDLEDTYAKKFGDSYYKAAEKRDKVISNQNN